MAPQSMAHKKIGASAAPSPTQSISTMRFAYQLAQVFHLEQTIALIC